MAKWAVGVTTVGRRRHDLLPQTLASLRDGGFERVDRLFVDGDNDPQGWEREFGVPATCRHPRIKVAGNWTLSLAELFIRHPGAERFAIFQDDVVCVKNLRQYLDRCRYPDGPLSAEAQPGYWNCWTTPNVEASAGGKAGWFRTQQNGRGACALVFSREAAITLLSSRTLVERPCDPVRGWRYADGGVVTAMKAAGWAEYCHSPSLVMHVGWESTIDKRGDPLGEAEDFEPYVWPSHYKEASFPGETWDALQMLSRTDGGWPCSAT